MKQRSKTAPPRSRRRRFFFALITVTLSLVLSLLVGEAIFRILERRENARNIYEGSGGHPVPDGHLGWKLSPGAFRVATAEFDVRGNVNSLLMNDAPYESEAEATRVRVLALGDSHTFAVGVSMHETWPKALERKLNAASSAGPYRVYNGGVSGYSMHQYLLRLRELGPVVRPQFVVLGLSYATDLYDLLPPDRGGWIYGGSASRDYYDFDQSRNLTLRHWDAQGPSAQPNSGARNVRQLLEYSAAFRYLRRSSLALFIGSHVTVNGQSLWPNMDVVLEEKITPKHEYQWQLFAGLLRLIKEECDRQNARLIVVGIPYLPQVYDDVWNSTFAGNQAYSRTAAIDRVRTECRRNDIAYVDALEPMQQQSRKSGRWLHYRKDAHPTAEGQDVIAEAIFRSEVIQPGSGLALIPK